MEDNQELSDAGIDYDICCVLRDGDPRILPVPGKTSGHPCGRCGAGCTLSPSSVEIIRANRERGRKTEIVCLGCIEQDYIKAMKKTVLN